MTKPNPFADLDALRRESGEVFHLDAQRDSPDVEPEPPKRKQKPGWERHYAKVPWAWIKRLHGTSGSTWELAMLLLYEQWRNGGQPVALSNILARQHAQLSRFAKHRALANLERIGLVEVRRRRGRSPRVVLKEPEHG
jgi:hypothetical protein